MSFTTSTLSSWFAWLKTVFFCSHHKPTFWFLSAQIFAMNTSVGLRLGAGMALASFSVGLNTPFVFCNLSCPACCCLLGSLLQFQVYHTGKGRQNIGTEITQLVLAIHLLEQTCTQTFTYSPSLHTPVVQHKTHKNPTTNCPASRAHGIRNLQMKNSLHDS